jgi:hypothetical protein
MSTSFSVIYLDKMPVSDEMKTLTENSVALQETELFAIQLA